MILWAYFLVYCTLKRKESQEHRGCRKDCEVKKAFSHYFSLRSWLLKINFIAKNKMECTFSTGYKLRSIFMAPNGETSSVKLSLSRNIIASIFIFNQLTKLWIHRTLIKKKKNIKGYTRIFSLIFQRNIDKNAFLICKNIRNSNKSFLVSCN